MTDQNWHLGQIKFFDNDKGFGFVKDVTNGQDYFVHISKIKTPPINDNDRVVFQLTPSRKKQGTLESKNVSHLIQFKSDTDFLILQFSQLKDFSFRKAILKALPTHCVTYLFEQELATQDRISNEIEYRNFTEKAYSINKLFEDVIIKETLSELISKHVEEIASNDYKVQLWIDNAIKLEPELNLIRNYFVTQKRNIQEKIYTKLSKQKFSI
jgi:cold shock protein